MTMNNSLESGKEPKSHIHLAAIILLLFGLAYAFLVPIFQAPDEPAHFARAYGVAEGQYILRDHPPELIRLILSSLSTSYDIENYPIFRDIREQMESSASRVPNVAYNSSQYSFIPYVFHAAITRLVMGVADPPQDIIISIYACRVATTIIYCLIFYLAVSIAPFCTWPVFWVMVTPMALSQSAVVSIDVLIFCCGLLVLCLGLGLEKVKSFICICFTAVFLLLVSKPPYAPLIIGLAVGSMMQGMYKWKKMITIGAACLIALGAGYLWQQTVISEGIYDHTFSYIHSYISEDISPSAQFNRLSHNPFLFGLVMTHTILEQGGRLGHEFVGVLGWQDLEIPMSAVWGWALLLPVAVLASGCPVHVQGPQRFVLGGSYIVSGILTIASVLLVLYLVWMPVGAPYVLAQGRYFHLPVLAALLGLSVIIPRAWRIRKGTCLKVLLLAMGAGINMSAILAVLHRYW